MKIEWTLASKNDYWKNIEYLEKHWSEKEILNFINEIDYSLNLLAKENVLFIKSDCPICLQNGCYKANYTLLFH